MRPLFIVFMLVSLNSLPQRTVAQAIAEPPVQITILADGKPVGPTSKVPISSQTITLTCQLTPEAHRQHPELDSNVIIKNAVINRVRGTTRVGFLNWSGSGNDLSIAFAPAEAPGDRYIIQLEDARIQYKNGTSVRLHKPIFYTISFRE
ncbi:hypothetical protein [Spirosoma aerolatum]|uniref:hypothetical protein n=1 Tax=Spirosoma aerolatum TaxID=1211326 RepID=UPI0009AF0E8A|nr:hypothetical protein [Spirosoma aerolatum]